MTRKTPYKPVFRIWNLSRPCTNPSILSYSPGDITGMCLEDITHDMRPEVRDKIIERILGVLYGSDEARRQMDAARQWCIDNPGCSRIAYPW